MLRWVSSLSDVTDCTRRDWAGTLQTYGLVWGLPIAAIVAGLFLNVGLRTAIWTIAVLAQNFGRSRKPRDFPATAVPSRAW